MRIAIFGSNGYIGKHLTHFLKQQANVSVCGFDLGPTSCFDDLEYRSLDITDKEAVKKTVFDFDQLYFFSGLTGTIDSLTRYDAFIEVNEKGLLNLLNALKEQGAKPKIIFPSTRLVYKGVKDKPLDEESEKEFKTLYAATKYNGELYLKMYNLYYDIDYTIFRICVPYGNLFDEHFSYGTAGFFIKQAKSGQDIQLYGDGSLKRTFTYVEDICRQIIEVSNHPQSSKETYNIAGETLSLNDVANLIASKYNVAVRYVPWPETALKSESGDTIFKSSKIERLVGVGPLRQMEHWVKNQFAQP